MGKREAKTEVDGIYVDLARLADEMVKKHASTLDTIVKKIRTDIESLSTKELMDYILELGIETYFFAQKKDFMTLKQSCADTLYKENYARALLASTGTVANKQHQATIDTMDNSAVKLLYEAVANLMKTRLDEAHRIANLLSNVLISKNAEAKLRAQETYGTTERKGNAETQRHCEED